MATTRNCTGVNAGNKNTGTPICTTDSMRPSRKEAVPRELPTFVYRETIVPFSRYSEFKVSMILELMRFIRENPMRMQKG